MDKGPLWATVHGVTQSRIRLKQLSMHSHYGPPSNFSEGKANEVMGFAHNVTRVRGLGGTQHRGRAWASTAQRSPDLHLTLCAPSPGPGTQRSPDKRSLPRLELNPSYHQHH